MILEHLKLMPPISDVAGADTFPVRKPDPRHILMLLERMGGNPERTVMIGDSIHDVEAAHGAGIPAVLVSWGYTAEARQRAGRRRRDRPFRRPARRAGTTRGKPGPLTTSAGTPYTRPFRALSSAGEHTLHTGGVVGSIPTAPTTYPFEIIGFH